MTDIELTDITQGTCLAEFCPKMGWDGQDMSEVTIARINKTTENCLFVSGCFIDLNDRSVTPEAIVHVLERRGEA